MIGFEAHSGRENRSRPSAFWAISLLCLGLLALLAVAQVAHMHPIDTDADRCPLCIVMHSAAPVAVATALIVMVRMGAAAPLVEARAVVRHWHPKLLTRPPPAGLRGI